MSERTPRWTGFPEAGRALRSRSEEETREIGRRLADAVRAGDLGPVVLLEGEMGAGKTVLVGGLAEGLGLDPASVQSPTFTLVHEYLDQQGELRLVHCDLYRLEATELDAAGIGELLEAPPAPLVVEWSERLPAPPPGAVTLRLTKSSGGSGERLVSVSRGDRSGPTG